MIAIFSADSSAVWMGPSSVRWTHLCYVRSTWQSDQLNIPVRVVAIDFRVSSFLGRGEMLEDLVWAGVRV